jgi:hypothetical protein
MRRVGVSRGYRVEQRKSGPQEGPCSRCKELERPTVISGDERMAGRLTADVVVGGLAETDGGPYGEGRAHADLRHRAERALHHRREVLEHLAAGLPGKSVVTSVRARPLASSPTSGLSWYAGHEEDDEI